MFAHPPPRAASRARFSVPPPGTWYKHPTFSPDGSRLAVAFNTEGARGQPGCRLQIVSLSSGLLPQGEPRTVLTDCQGIRGIAWTPDGDSLVVSGFRLPNFYAWRVSADKAVDPERIELAGAEAVWPAMSHLGGRLAFARSIVQADLWRLERGGKPAPFLSSTARDTFPQFSARRATHRIPICPRR